MGTMRKRMCKNFTSRQITTNRHVSLIINGTSVTNVHRQTNLFKNKAKYSSQFKGNF